MKLLFYFLLVIAPAWGFSQNNLVIKGAAPMLKDGTEITIEQIVPKRLWGSGKTYITKIRDHSFKFILNADGAELYYLSANGYGNRMFLEPGNANIAITDSIFRSVTVTDNSTSLEYDSYTAQFATISPTSPIMEYDRARRDFDKYIHGDIVDAVAANNKRQKMDSLLLLRNKELLTLGLNWIKQHPNSYINTSVLYDQIAYMPEDKLKQAFNSLPAYVTTNIWGRELRYRIDSLFIGATAATFSETDTNGRQVSLASFRGEYVLVDFWASWCIPCRADNPNLVKAMEKFKDKNFNIVGISLDEKNDAWLSAIKQDGLYWTQLSNLQGQKNPVAIKYYIPSIPDNYLIDPNGKIIAKDLHGDELIAKLNNLFK